MGQYYHASFIKDREVKSKEDVQGWFSSWDIKTKYTRPDGSTFVSGQGSKLMEHSYIGNTLVSAVERELAKEPKRLVWAGDYADKEPNKIPWEWKDTDGKTHTEEKANIYHLGNDDNNITPKGYVRPIGKKYRYIVNHDKEQFVDKKKCPDIPDMEDLQIHPLPLLTAEGNGQGGGDYRGEHPLVGTWARDLISIETRRPKDYQEVIPNFQE